MLYDIVEDRSLFEERRSGANRKLFHVKHFYDVFPVQIQGGSFVLCVSITTYDMSLILFAPRMNTVKFSLPTVFTNPYF